MIEAVHDLASFADELAAAMLELERSPGPVHLARLAGRLGVRHIQTEVMPESGRLVWDIPEPAIFLNGCLGPTRRRFVLAHELAHAALRTDPDAIFESIALGGQTEEKLCNLVAARLLLPPDVMLSCVSDDAGTQVASLEDLAQHAGASMLTTLRRLGEVRRSRKFLFIDASLSGTSEWSVNYIVTNPYEHRGRRDAFYLPDQKTLRRAVVDGTCERGSITLRVAPTTWVKGHAETLYDAKRRHLRCLVESWDVTAEPTTALLNGFAQGHVRRRHLTSPLRVRVTP